MPFASKHEKYTFITSKLDPLWQVTVTAALHRLLASAPINFTHLKTLLLNNRASSSNGLPVKKTLCGVSVCSIYCTRYQRIGTITNRPTPCFLANTTTPPQAVWAYSSGLHCSLRGPLSCATSIHRSPPCWLASPKRPTPSVLASNNRQRSQTTQPWTSLCITASNGSSFLAMHRGNGYALQACHQMMICVPKWQ